MQLKKTIVILCLFFIGTVNVEIYHFSLRSGYILKIITEEGVTFTQALTNSSPMHVYIISNNLQQEYLPPSSGQPLLQEMLLEAITINQQYEQGAIVYSQHVQVMPTTTMVHNTAKESVLRPTLHAPGNRYKANTGCNGKNEYPCSFQSCDQKFGNLTIGVSIINPTLRKIL